LDREELKKILPHREPMLLIDEATLVSDEQSVGSVRIRGDEWFMKGHFQTCCITVLKRSETATPYFTGMNKLRFRGVVRPGDTIRFECRLTASRPPFYFAKAKGFVNDTECVSGEFSFAVKESA
jgi:3-hydroxyacyl-[acyl-carrier-protein] dehydratase